MALLWSRIRCIVGRHEWIETHRMAPPAEWRDLPTFQFKRCLHCPATDYDMVWPK